MELKNNGLPSGPRLPNRASRFFKGFQNFFTSSVPDKQSERNGAEPSTGHAEAGAASAISSHTISTARVSQDNGTGLNTGTEGNGTKRAQVAQESTNKRPKTQQSVAPSQTRIVASGLGLIELYSGQSPEIDIFFIHGLMGDRVKTWQKANVLWPKDLLPSRIPNARIFTFGYDADATRFFTRVGTSTIERESQAFMRAVHRVRRGNYERPIIFVGHSLGGILIKDGLSWSKSQKTVTQINIHEVFEATRGIIFLGTPHRGANGQYADFGILLERMVSFMQHDTNPHLLAALHKDSEVISRISNAFNVDMEDYNVGGRRRPLIFSFIEDLPMSLVKFTGRVVDQNSGYIGMAKEEKGTIHADHFNLVKFSSEEDEGFLSIVDALQDCITAATEKKAPEEPELSVPRRAEVLSQLGHGINPKSDQHMIRRGRLPKTCEWITHQDIFKRWVDGNPQFLLLTGPAGCGKSHVVSMVIDTLTQFVGQSYGSVDKSDTLLAHLFCRDPDSKPRSLVDGITSLVAQLIRLDSAYADEVAAKLQDVEKTDEAVLQNLTWIWENLLVNSIALSRRPCVYLVLDGLDECPYDARRELLGCIYQQRSETSGGAHPTNIRVFCSGRPEIKREATEAIMTSFASVDVPTIEVTWQTKDDIEVLISTTMTKMKFVHNRRLITKVSKAISSQTEGNFLWTDVKLKEFMKAETGQAVMTLLSQINKDDTWDKIYGDVINSLIASHQSDLLANILRETILWLVYSAQKVCFSLLREVLEYEFGTEIFSLGELIESFGSIIEIGGFQRLSLPYSDRVKYSNSRDTLQDEPSSDDEDEICFDDGSGIIGGEILRIRHNTFLEWYSNHESADPRIWTSKIDAHLHIQIQCLEILVERQEKGKRFPDLLRYAQRNWCGHMFRIDWHEASEVMIVRVVEFLHRLFTTWDLTWPLLVHTPMHHWIIGGLIPDLEKAFSTIFNRFSTSDPSTLEDPRTPQQSWAHEIVASKGTCMEALYASMISLAETEGFFNINIKLGDHEGRKNYALVLSSLHEWFRVLGVLKMERGPSWLYYGRSLKDSESGFWLQSVWQRYPASKQFLLALVSEKDDEACITDFLELHQIMPNNAIVMWEIAHLYNNQRGHDAAQEWIQRCYNACGGDPTCKAEALWLEASIIDSIPIQSGGSHQIEEAQSKFTMAVQYGSTAALETLASLFANMPGDNNDLSAWMVIHEQFGTLAPSPPTLEDTFARAILRHGTFHPWHTTFSRAVFSCGKTKSLISAYKRAIQLASTSESEVTSSLAALGYRYHLAQAYASTERHTAKAVTLLMWVLNCLTRFHFSDDGGVQNRLYTLTAEQLAHYQVLTPDHPLLDFTGTFQLHLMDFSRLSIIFGKSLEENSSFQEAANGLYLRVFHRVFEKISHQKYRIHSTERMCLGNALLALGAGEDAIRALNWACLYPGMVENGGIASDTSSSSLRNNHFDTQNGEPGTEVAIRRARIGSGVANEAWFKWDVSCDGCMKRTSYYSDATNIQGYRYKCCQCAEIDLCRGCWESWTSRTFPFKTLRFCRQNHKFIKLPGLLTQWPDINPRDEAMEIALGHSSPAVRTWLQEIAKRYDVLY